MPTFPVRGLAEKGVLMDPLPSQLDLTAWSRARNIRFHANLAERADIFRGVVDPFPDSPAFCAGRRVASTGTNGVIVAGEGGRLWNYSAQTTTEVTPVSGGITSLYLPTETSGGSGYTTAPAVTIAAPPSGGTQATATANVVNGVVVSFNITASGSGYVPGVSYPVTIAAPPSGGTQAYATASAPYVPSTDPRAWTSSFLGDVIYLNRPDNAPVYLGPQGTQFATLPGWDTSWRCRSLRKFGDYMVALNVTKGQTMFDNLVKWSNLTLIGLPPDSWNSNDPDTSAGENPLEQVRTPIVDGGEYRDMFVIYTEDDAWGMFQTGTQSIFTWRRLFGGRGLIAPNCFAEADALHYVFDQNDIYVHDGIQARSIINGRNRNRVFRSLNRAYTESFFVSYNPARRQVLFAYVTGSPEAYFQGAARCNEGAVYDIHADTWSFVDLPNVGAMSPTMLSGPVWTPTSVPSTVTWANVGGSPFTQDGAPEVNIVTVSETGDSGGLIQANRLLAYDAFSNGLVNSPYVPDANAPPILERTGLDLDQLGADIQTEKLVRRILPLVQTEPGNPLQVQVGSQMFPSGTVTWAPAVSFDPTTQYKVDVMRGGRFLAVSFTTNQPSDFGIAGFDVDVIPNGAR